MNEPSNEFLQAWDACADRCANPLPSSVLEAARQVWFDTCAVTAAGAGENTTRASVAVAEGRALTAADAGLVLGTASHALDYDDVCMLATCHPSAPMVSALMALLPRARPGLALADLLAAHVLGTETQLRLGAWLGFRHYGLGFHATSTLGSVGAAAAAAHLLGLPRGQAHVALSIAASSACGLRANFGTDTKPLHVGFAAAAGIRAALLAQAGANASDDVWGANGFFHAFNGGVPATALPWQPGMPFALQAPGFELKRFPSCYLTHRLVAGVLALRERRGGVADADVRIAIEMPRNGTAPLKHPRASTGLEGKFSGPYCAAAAWIDGRVGLAAFTDEAVRRPALQAFMRQVTLVERTTEGESLDSAPVVVEVRGNGWTEKIVVDWAPGSLADPFTRDQLLAKWRDCATHAGLPGDLRQMLDLLDAPLDTSAGKLLLPLRDALIRACGATTG